MAVVIAANDSQQMALSLLRSFNAAALYVKHDYENNLKLHNLVHTESMTKLYD